MLYSVENVGFEYHGKKVFENLSFQVPQNQILCILGPSGCGKTTLLKLLAGILKPQGGTIDSFFEKQKSFLFQEPRLLPFCTVKENLYFTTGGKMSDNVIEGEIQTYLDLVRLSAYQDFYPDELSGGMQQRVSIARAFLYPSEILLLDEPFKSLDIEIKLSVIESFKLLWESNPRTTVMVTHDVLAASLLGDQIMLLSSNPTEKKAYLENQVPREDRTLENGQITELQNTLYRYFLEEGRKL